MHSGRSSHFVRRVQSVLIDLPIISRTVSMGDHVIPDRRPSRLWLLELGSKR